MQLSGEELMLTPDGLTERIATTAGSKKNELDNVH